MWRDKTTVQLIRGTDTPVTSGPAPSSTVPGERVLDGLRLVAHTALASAVILLCVVPVLTATAGLVAASRHLGTICLGRASTLREDVVRDVRQTTGASWPISVGTFALILLGIVNLEFLATVPSLLAGAFYAANLSLLFIGLLLAAAAVHELADDVAVRGYLLLTRAVRRACTPSRWHLGFLVATVAAGALFLVSPLLAVVFGPGLVVLLPRFLHPLPATAQRHT